MPDAPLKVYATSWCSDCDRIAHLLGQHEVQYDWIDVENDPAAQAFLEQHADGRQLVPTVQLPDGTVLVEPTNEELARRLGLPAGATTPYHDLVIIGGGPAGLTAAIYAAREGLDSVVLEKAMPGGQAAITEWIDNYPGFPEGIGGQEFAERTEQQARRFGVDIRSFEEVASLSRDGRYLVVRSEGGEEYRGQAVLIATGSSYKRLGIAGEDQYIGRGISYCATCDGPFFRDQEVAVVGGGNSAAEEGVFLTKFASKVILLVRRGHLTAAKIAADKALTHPKMDIRFNTRVEELEGEGKLSGVVVRDTRTEERQVLPVAGLFVFIGLEPNTGFLRGVVNLDEAGFVITDETLQTSLEGVFAAGDVRRGSTKQVASAAGEGATAVLMIRHYLRDKTAIVT